MWFVVTNVVMKRQVTGFLMPRDISGVRCVKDLSKQKQLGVIAVVLCYVAGFNRDMVGRKESLWRLDIK